MIDAGNALKIDKWQKRSLLHHECVHSKLDIFIVTLKFYKMSN